MKSNLNIHPSALISDSPSLFRSNPVFYNRNQEQPMTEYSYSLLVS